MIERRNYKIEYRNAFNKSYQSAKRCFNVRRSDIEKGTIECKTEASIWSWGETILIKIKSVAPQETQIIIESSPWVQLFDWGKSKENIENFFRIFESNGGD